MFHRFSLLVTFAAFFLPNQIKWIHAAEIKESIDTPFLFIDTPFKGNFEPGVLAAIDERRFPIQMISPETKFTIVRVLTNEVLNDKSPSYWSGILIQIYDEKRDLVFDHKYEDKDAFPLHLLKSNFLIEPISYVDVRTAFAWKARLGDIARNFDSQDQDKNVIAYTAIFPFEPRPGVSREYKIEVTPLINDQPEFSLSVMSQLIFVKNPVRLRRYRIHPFRGVFEKKNDVFVPAIPSAVLRSVDITHDVIIEHFDRNDFTLGFWPIDDVRKWMKLSFYQFRPLGKRLWKYFHGLEVYLINADDGSEILLEKFNDADVPEYDHEVERGASYLSYNDYKKNHVMDRATADLVKQMTPPSWAPSHHIDKLDVSSVAFKMKPRVHGGVLNKKFELQNGRVFAYSLWISYSPDVDSGRFYFKFKNVFNAGKKNSLSERETFSDDFFVGRMSQFTSEQFDPHRDIFDRDIREIQRPSSYPISSPIVPSQRATKRPSNYPVSSPMVPSQRAAKRPSASVSSQRQITSQNQIASVGSQRQTASRNLMASQRITVSNQRQSMAINTVDGPQEFIEDSLFPSNDIIKLVALNDRSKQAQMNEVIPNDGYGLVPAYQTPNFPVEGSSLESHVTILPFLDFRPQMAFLATSIVRRREIFPFPFMDIHIPPGVDWAERYVISDNLDKMLGRAPRDIDSPSIWLIAADHHKTIYMPPIISSTDLEQEVGINAAEENIKNGIISSGPIHRSSKTVNVTPYPQKMVRVGSKQQLKVVRESRELSDDDAVDDVMALRARHQIHTPNSMDSLRIITE